MAQSKRERREVFGDGGYVDLDEEVFVDPVTGERITEAKVEEWADEAERSGPPGRPSLTRGDKGPSPVVTYRVPKSLRSRLDRLASAEHRRASQIARDALEEYLERHDSAK